MNHANIERVNKPIHKSRWLEEAEVRMHGEIGLQRRAAMQADQKSNPHGRLNAIGQKPSKSSACEQHKSQPRMSPTTTQNKPIAQHGSIQTYIQRCHG